jgi:hypothetical protein
MFSACGAGDLEFLTGWAGQDADGFAKLMAADGYGASDLLAAVQRN